MDRPGLERLMAEIEAGRIDIVVVYQIDRLMRSLADLARLIEVFDRQRVSFVSVTQQFDTSTSMDRSMLNILLSFGRRAANGVEVTASRPGRAPDRAAEARAHARFGQKESQAVMGMRAWLAGFVVETRRIELPTFALRTRRSPS